MANTTITKQAYDNGEFIFCPIFHPMEIIRDPLNKVIFQDQVGYTKDGF